jgi:hypothetical protein
MKKSMTRVILSSSIVLFSIILVIIPSNTYAEEINVKSFALEETAIIQVTNNSNENIKSFKIWAGSDYNFKSFKTEKGWVGEKTPLGVIIFKSSENIKPGESVKFGIKTDKANSGINWKALNKTGEQIDIGKVLSKEIPKVSTSGTGIFIEPIFRIIPEKPNIGSTIRITGDGFEGSQEFDVYIDTKKIGDFVTDSNGHFITTMKIPSDQNDGSVNMKIKNKSGEEQKISFIIGSISNEIPESEKFKLVIQDYPDTVQIGDFLDIFGTAQPNDTITLEISDSDGGLINSGTEESDYLGNWKFEQSIKIQFDTIVGKYSITISDDDDNIIRNLLINSDKTITITPSNLKFNKGEIMKFSGTALPNKIIEISIKEPAGDEIFSEDILVNESGFVEFEYQTEQTSIKGTYTIVVTQEKNKELIFVGLEQQPVIPLLLELDKVNYKTGDNVKIVFSGKALDVIKLRIIDPQNARVGEIISITLQSNNRGIYEIDLKDYGSGVYSAVVSKGSEQDTKIFTVGLQAGSGTIKINATKSTYLAGDSIVLLGDATKNSIMIISLMDPDGNIIRDKNTFSNSNGRISDNSFKIPSDAKQGTWKVMVRSGSVSNSTEFQVLSIIKEGMILSIAEGLEIDREINTITIKISGAQQNVQVKILTNDGEIIDSFSSLASSQGNISLPWLLPNNLEPGTYTIDVIDAFNTVQLIFEIL